MQSKEYEFNGGSMNGFLMLFLVLAMVVGMIYFIILTITHEDGWFMLPAVILFICIIIGCCGFSMQEPNEAKVLTFFGKYVGTFRKTGFYWINPFMSVKKVSLRARNFNADPIKVNDKAGNPVMIGLVVVWRLKDTYKAIFDIDTDVANANTVGGAAGLRMNKFERFVAVQSDSALRQVAGMYAYDNDGDDTHEVTLRSGSEEVNDVLLRKLNERLEMAGLEVTEARINYLAYAAEIASVMLRRQQADAIISAREKIVEGAVSMVELALNKLSEREVVQLDEEKKATMVSNLLVVLCADESASPVINTGSLY